MPPSMITSSPSASRPRTASATPIPGPSPVRVRRQHPHSPAPRKSARHQPPPRPRGKSARGPGVPAVPGGPGRRAGTAPGRTGPIRAAAGGGRDAGRGWARGTRAGSRSGPGCRSGACRGTRHRSTRVPGVPQPPRPGVEPGHEQAGMRFARGPEALLHAEVELHAVAAEPAAAARGQRGRFRDLVQPEHVAVELAERGSLPGGQASCTWWITRVAPCYYLDIKIISHPGDASPSVCLRMRWPRGARVPVPGRPRSSSRCRRGRACARRRGRAPPRSPPSPGPRPPPSPRWSSIIAPAQTAPTGFASDRPAMSGADPCTGSNRPGPVPVGRDVRARREAHPALDGGADVGDDVAEEVRRHHHVEPLRLA